MTAPTTTSAPTTTATVLRLPPLPPSCVGGTAAPGVPACPYVPAWLSLIVGVSFFGRRAPGTVLPDARSACPADSLICSVT